MASTSYLSHAVNRSTLAILASLENSVSIIGLSRWPGPTYRSADGWGAAATRSVWPAAGAVAALLVAGCASAPKPTEITGLLQASANINPSVSKRASPLLVRVYELKSTTAFNSADFVSLYQRDAAELGAEMVAREEFVLNPGDSRPLTKTAAPETRFVGVLAAFRDLDHAKWRSVVAIQPGQKQRLVISAEELSVTATVSK
jgi:type VI secretion system protein VasD